MTYQIAQIAKDLFAEIQERPNIVNAFIGKQNGIVQKLRTIIGDESQKLKSISGNYLYIMGDFPFFNGSANFCTWNIALFRVTSYGTDEKIYSFPIKYWKNGWITTFRDSELDALEAQDAEIAEWILKEFEVGLREYGDKLQEEFEDHSR